LRQRKGQNLQNEGLNMLLAELTRSGQADSTGIFTISLDKARDKLSKFQLPEPRMYVLNILASAVCGGATLVEVSIDRSALEFRFNGLSLGEFDLLGLTNQLLSPTEMRLYELAVAFNAVQSLDLEAVALESWHGEEGWVLKIEDGRTRVVRTTTPFLDTSAPLNRVLVREKFRTKRVLGNLFGSPLEKTALIRTAAFAPLSTLEVNGQAVGRKVAVGCTSPSSLAWAHLYSNQPKLNVQTPDPNWAQSSLITSPKSSLQGFEAVLALDGPAKAKDHGMILVCNGVAFERPSTILACPFGHGLVSGPFHKNVSHTDLAEDQTYNGVIQWLDEELDKLVVQRLDCELPIPGHLHRPMLEWAQLLVGRLTAAQQLEDAVKIQRWVKEQSFLMNLRNDKLWESLLEELEELGPSPQGHALERRLRTSLTKASRQALESTDLHDCQALCSRTYQLAQLRQASWLESAKFQDEAIRVLCGTATDSICGEVRLDALRLRHQQQEALALPTSPHTRGQLYLSLGRFEEAEISLREALLQCAKPEILEDLSDSLAFAQPGSKQRRMEALELREQAVAMRSQAPFPWGSFLLDDLVALSRGTVSLLSWLSYRIRALASETSSKEVNQIDSNLRAAAQKLTRSVAGSVRIKSTVLTAEKTFTVNHPFARASRSRAVHFLRQAGYWVEADDLLARGRLIDLLHQSLTDPANNTFAS
jgi:tetratricopeptide (TPR) repeat protein